MLLAKVAVAQLERIRGGQKGGTALVGATALQSPSERPSPARPHCRCGAARTTPLPSHHVLPACAPWKEEGTSSSNSAGRRQQTGPRTHLAHAAAPVTLRQPLPVCDVTPNPTYPPSNYPRVPACLSGYRLLYLSPAPTAARGDGGPLHPHGRQGRQGAPQAHGRAQGAEQRVVPGPGGQGERQRGQDRVHNTQ